MNRLKTLLQQELKLAFASLLRVPGFSMTVILTLAVTLGALICIFSLNNLLLVKPLPYPNADKLVVVNHTYTEDGEIEFGAQTLPGMLLWYKKQTVLEQMALIEGTYQNISSHVEQPAVAVNFVTPEYFSLLGVPMLLGRAMNFEEGLDQRKAVAVISYHSWLKWFGGDKGIIGKKTRIGDNSYQIIGVIAQGFNPPQIGGTDLIEVWLPWDFQGMDPNNWGRQTGNVFGL
ncbi:MAG: ABC transporter permease, partial [Psychrosphaera sp.]|nr:ABC transporter permease [Psychrosphaera sp.]